MKILEKPEIRRDSTGVVVVDMQNDFVSRGGKFVENSPGYYEAAQSIIGPTMELLGEASRAGVPIIFTVTHYQKGHVDAGPLSMSRELGALERGSWGAELVEELVRAAGKTYYIIEKNRYNAFYGTSLDILLRGLGIKTLVLTGFAANICVETTARAARDADYYPVVLRDCTASFTPQLCEGALTNIDRFFGAVAELKEILPLIQGKIDKLSLARGGP